MTKDVLYKGFILVVMRMDRKWRSRDQTITMALTWSNFEEYFEANKYWFVFKFSKVDKLFSAIIRNYIHSQLLCITRGHDNTEGREILDNLIYETVKENTTELMLLIKMKYPKISQEIYDLNGTHI